MNLKIGLIAIVAAVYFLSSVAKANVGTGVYNVLKRTLQEAKITSSKSSLQQISTFSSKDRYILLQLDTSISGHRKPGLFLHVSYDDYLPKNVPRPMLINDARAKGKALTRTGAYEQEVKFIADLLDIQLVKGSESMIFPAAKEGAVRVSHTYRIDPSKTDAKSLEEFVKSIDQLITEMR